MTIPILYSFRRCPYAMRARLALAISATQVELREVKLSAKPEAMLAASPKATVPVLVLPDGEVIDQSMDIMHWALGHNDPESWLTRDNPDLIAMNDGQFKYHLDRYKYPERHGDSAIMHRQSALVFLQQIEGRLSRATNLCGAAPGLADAAIIPFIRQYAAVDPGWFADQPLVRVKTWLSDYLASDLFHSIMIRVSVWASQDVPIFVNWRGETTHAA